MITEKPRTLPEICTSKNPITITLQGITYCKLAMNEKEIKCIYLQEPDHNNLRPCSIKRYTAQN